MDANYEFFARLLENSGMRASDVVKGTKITHSTLTDWKKGRYTPKIDKIQKIADFFEVPVDYFETGKLEADRLAEEHKRSLNSLQTELALRDVLEESELFKGIEFSKNDILDILKYIGYIASRKEGVD